MSETHCTDQLELFEVEEAQEKQTKRADKKLLYGSDDFKEKKKKGKEKSVRHALQNENSLARIQYASYQPVLVAANVENQTIADQAR